MGDWNAVQYAKFLKERTQPVQDLIGRIRDCRAAQILDIGCGPGNSTAALAEAFPAARILGVDASEDMLAKAQAAHPDLCFRKCWVPEGLAELGEHYDLVFSNACIHWIPGQAELLQAVFAVMRPGGTLAVQIPLTQKAPFYRVLYRLMEEPRWQAAGLGEIHNFHNLKPEEYYDVLSDLSDDVQIWETTYYHRMDSARQVLEWYRGSGLRPYLQALPESERNVFEAELLEQMERTYPVQHDGSVILKMPRLFVCAARR